MLAVWCVVLDKKLGYRRDSARRRSLYAVQGHSRKFMLVPIEIPNDFLLCSE